MGIIVGINGFGRIGRIVFRKFFENPEVQLSAINDPAIDIEYICYLIKFDSTHGKLDANISYKDNEIVINDLKIKIFRERHPSKVPWETVGAQYIIEATGMFTNMENASIPTQKFFITFAQGHLERRFVRRVIVTAPSSDIPMIIMGVNDNEFKQDHKVLSCASSTLYCLAPIIKVLNDCYGVSEGFVTSIHAMTPSLKPLDGLCLRGKHWRDHRSIHQNIIPANTGACKALAKVIPEVKDKLTGIAFRVPIVNVSCLDISIRLNAATSLSDIVKSVEKAGQTCLKKIIKTSNENAVSSDFIGDSYSCTLDVDSSLELNSNFFKLVCWYENEYSYATRVLDTILFFERQNGQYMLTTNTWTGLKLKLPSLDLDISKKCNLSNDFHQRFAQKLTQKKLKCPITLPSPDNVKKQNETYKVWNDECEASKNCKCKGTKFSSFFKFWTPINTEKAKEIDCFKAKEHLEVVKKEFSKMVLITEDLLQKSNNDKVNLKKLCNRYKKDGTSRKTTIDTQNDTDTITERNNETVQTNNAILKECGDCKNKITSESCSKIKCNEDIINNEDKKECICNIGKSRKKKPKTLVTDKNQNVNLNFLHSDLTDVMTQTDEVDDEDDRDKIIAIADYITSKNYNMSMIDQKLKEHNMKLIDSGNNMCISLNYNKECLGNDCEDIKDMPEDNVFTSKINELLQDDNTKTSFNLTNFKVGKKKVDVYDKLDSTSATNSNESFGIQEKKSQIIDITDLTNSLEDIEQLDKICRIIEISDDLSNELFSPLNSDAESMAEKRSWSFKDLCERIQLEDFCKKVFGETGV